MSQKLSPDCERELLAFAQNEYGIILKGIQLRRLNDAFQISRKKFGHETCKDYIKSLFAAEPNNPERTDFVSCVTVEESYFFRDAGQIEFIRKIWLPRMLEHKKRTGDKQIRIWCAGCSYGQEPYTLAILLKEELPEFNDWIIHLLASDINIDALQKARKGEYAPWSFRTTSDEMKGKYFKSDGGDFKISPEIAKMVEFEYLNLLSTDFPSIQNRTSHLDLILCRNVFIYFDADTSKAIMQRFSQCLGPGGHLIIGASDMAETTQDGMDFIFENSINYFKKPIENATPSKIVSTPKSKEPNLTRRAKNNQISPRTFKNFTPKSPPKPKIKAEAKSTNDLAALVKSGAWAEVRQEVEITINREGVTPENMCLLAEALANLGITEEAISASEESILLDPMNDRATFINGLILMELGETERAETQFKRALYLNRHYIDAHYQLGLLQLRNGKQAAAVKSLKNALDIVSADTSQHSYGNLADVLRGEIEMLSDGNIIR
jgi:chemotaxis protein methyltransferase CheR